MAVAVVDNMCLVALSSLLLGRFPFVEGVLERLTLANLAIAVVAVIVVVVVWLVSIGPRTVIVIVALVARGVFPI